MLVLSCHHNKCFTFAVYDVLSKYFSCSKNDGDDIAVSNQQFCNLVQKIINMMMMMLRIIAAAKVTVPAQRSQNRYKKYNKWNCLKRINWIVNFWNNNNMLTNLNTFVKKTICLSVWLWDVLFCLVNWLKRYDLFYSIMSYLYACMTGLKFLCSQFVFYVFAKKSLYLTTVNITRIAYLLLHNINVSKQWFIELLWHFKEIF